MRNNTIRLTKAQASIQEWRKTVDILVQQVQDWSKNAPGWQLELFPNEVREEELGTYFVPVLEIKMDEGEVTLEPIPRRSPDDEIRAYLKAWPTLSRVRLAYAPEQNTWEVTAANVPLRIAWNESNFRRLVKDLLTTP